jgi:hypothetical protein
LPAAARGIELFNQQVLDRFQQNGRRWAVVLKNNKTRRVAMLYVVYWLGGEEDLLQA